MPDDLHRRLTPQARDLISFAAVYAAALAVLAFVFGWRRPCWSDECHFIEVIADFTERGFSAIPDYNAATPPLFFLLYAGWGGLFGHQTEVLRLLTMLLGLGTGIAFHVLAVEASLSRRAAFFLPFILLLNPYGAGLSIFVYTDMAMMLFLLLALRAGTRNRPWSSGAASATALLMRQYAVFFNVAYAAVSLLRYGLERNRKALAGVAASALSLLPIAALFVLWGGVSPPVALAPFGEESPVFFRPSNLVLYIAIIPVFLFPAAMFRIRAFRYDARTHMCLIIASCAYFLAPVAPSAVTLQFTAHDTVGLFHRFLSALLPSHTLVHAVWFLCFLAGLHILYAVGRSAADAIRRGDCSTALLIDFSIMSFLLIMPWSYQTWEKYAVPLIPFLGLRILMFSKDSGQPGDRSGS